MKAVLVIGMLLSSIVQAAPKLTHGMVVFGDVQRTYLYHLPMKQGPHAFQMILEAKVEGYPRSMAAGHYQEAMAAGDRTLYTVEPEKFDVDAILAGQISQLTAVLYRGHFEEEGQSMGPVSLKDIRVVYHSPLVTENGEASPTYLLLDQKYLIHKVERLPSFDQIVVLKKLRDPCKPATRLCGEIPESLLDVVRFSEADINTPLKVGFEFRPEWFRKFQVTEVLYESFRDLGTDAHHSH